MERYYKFFPVSKHHIEGTAKLAEEWGLTVNVIGIRAKELGVLSPRSLKMKKNLESINSSYFCVWSPQMAYDLGNGFADGSVEIDSWGRYRYLLAVQTLDESLILGTLSRIGSFHNVRRRVKISTITGKEIQKTSVNITNHDLAKSLVDQHGMIPNKSEIDIDFPEVPNLLRPHFLRGFFDGDGSVSYSNWETPKSTNQLYFQGTPRFIDGVRNCLIQAIPGLLEPSLSKYYGTIEQHRITWAAKEQLRLLYTYLYPPGEYPHLVRKKDKLKFILSIS
jgi:hypothetical protein